MISEDFVYEICDGAEVEPCEEQIKNHQWGKIKAEGWFFTKDGQAFCPKHHPDWVETWRRGRAKKQLKGF